MASFFTCTSRIDAHYVTFYRWFCAEEVKILRRIAIAVVNIGQEKLKAT